MRFIITLLLALAVLLCIASCTSESSRRAKIFREEAQYGYHAIVVQNSTGTFKMLNDSVALRMKDNVFFLKGKDEITGELRYFRIK